MVRALRVRAFAGALRLVLGQDTLLLQCLFPPRYINRYGRRGGLMVSAPDSGASVPGSSPGRGHNVVFLGKTLYSHSASLHPGV